MTVASLCSATKYAPVSGRLLMLGFGSVGQAVLPLLLRHLTVQAAQISIIAASDAGIEQASNMGVAMTVQRLTEDNWQALLTPCLAPGDMLLNLSVDVCSLSLMALCRQRGAGSDREVGRATDRDRVADLVAVHLIGELVLVGTVERLHHAELVVEDR